MLAISYFVGVRKRVRIEKRLIALVTFYRWNRIRITSYTVKTLLQYKFYTSNFRIFSHSTTTLKLKFFYNFFFVIHILRIYLRKFRLHSYLHSYHLTIYITLNLWCYYCGFCESRWLFSNSPPHKNRRSQFLNKLLFDLVNPSLLALYSATIFFLCHSTRNDFYMSLLLWICRRDSDHSYEIFEIV